MVAAMETVRSRRALPWLVACALLGPAVWLLTACAPTSSAPADVTFLIPRGTEAALERGEPAFQFPKEIHVATGRSVVITNDD